MSTSSHSQSRGRSAEEEEDGEATPPPPAARRRLFTDTLSADECGELPVTLAQVKGGYEFTTLGQYTVRSDGVMLEIHSAPVPREERQRHLMDDLGVASPKPRERRIRLAEPVDVDNVVVVQRSGLTVRFLPFLRKGAREI